MTEHETYGDQSRARRRSVAATMCRFYRASTTSKVKRRRVASTPADESND